MLADDNRRKNRHHRQHARRECQKNAEAEEQGPDQREIAAGERIGDAIGVVDHLALTRRRRAIRCRLHCGRSLRLRRRLSRRTTIAEQVAKYGATDLVDAFHRRIAKPLVRTTLGRHHERPAAICGRLLNRHLDHNGATIRLHVLAEGLIEMDLSGRHLRLAKFYVSRLGSEGKALPVQVVAICHVEANLDGLLVDLSGGKSKGLLRRQEIVFGRRMCNVPEEEAGEYSQPKCGDMSHQIPARCTGFPHCSDAATRHYHVLIFRYLRSFRPCRQHPSLHSGPSPDRPANRPPAAMRQAPARRKDARRGSAFPRPRTDAASS